MEKTPGFTERTWATSVSARHPTVKTKTQLRTSKRVKMNLRGIMANHSLSEKCACSVDISEHLTQGKRLSSGRRKRSRGAKASSIPRSTASGHELPVAARRPQRDFSQNLPTFHSHEAVSPDISKAPSRSFRGATNLDIAGKNCQTHCQFRGSSKIEKQDIIR